MLRRLGHRLTTVPREQHYSHIQMDDQLRHPSHKDNRKIFPGLQEDHMMVSAGFLDFCIYMWRKTCRYAKRTASRALMQVLSNILAAKVVRNTPQRSFNNTVIVANLGSNNGIAMGALYQYKAMKELGVNVTLLDVSEKFDKHYHSAVIAKASIFIMHCGGPETVLLLRKVMPNPAGAYRIAYWAWELPDPAPDWIGYDRLVDEIWTPSEFSRDSIAKMTNKPIHVVPHYIQSNLQRRSFNQEVFKVLVLADSRSSFARKNPAGAIRAFRSAFSDSTSAHLIVKFSGRSADISYFIKEMGIDKVRNVTIIESHLTSGEMVDLFRSADVLLSLHRSEGFGLPMLEAMACGTPVIATAWSGSTDFLNSDNSYPIRYNLVPVEDPYQIYSKSCWADPDIPMATNLLKYLQLNKGDLEAKSEACFRYFVENCPRYPL